MTEQSTTPSFDPIRTIEDHAVFCNMSPWKLLITAGVDPGSMSKWRKGRMPNSRTIVKILTVQPLPVEPAR